MRVISNSLLHHLADPGVLWDAVRAAAAPEASRVRDGSAAPAVPGSGGGSWWRCMPADAPDVLRRDFFNSLLAAFRPDEVRSQLAAAGLPASGWRSRATGT